MKPPSAYAESAEVALKAAERLRTPEPHERRAPDRDAADYHVRRAAVFATLALAAATERRP